MPVASSSFHPPFYLTNGHVQTILPVLFRRPPALPSISERLELADGDFVDLDWMRAGNRRLVILTHGLEGCSRNGYIRGMAAAVQQAGWDAMAWNFRGCGEELNRLARFYHSGETKDLGALISHAAGQYQEIALVGFSLGGNVTLKYLGEASPHPAILGGVGISVPVDLASSARKLDRDRVNHIYLRRFLVSLVAKAEAKAAAFPADLDVIGARRIRSFQEFDDRYTAPLHGFRNAAHYWEESSARRYLDGITVPALLLNARNDPFLAPECFPFAEAERSALFTLEVPASGGHVGFLDLKNRLQPWSEVRVVEFLRTLPIAVSR